MCTNTRFAIALERRGTLTSGANPTGLGCEFGKRSVFTYTRFCRVAFVSIGHRVKNQYALIPCFGFSEVGSFSNTRDFCCTAAPLSGDGKLYIFHRQGRGRPGEKSTVGNLSPQGSVLTDEDFFPSFAGNKAVWRAYGNAVSGVLNSRPAGNQIRVLGVAGIFRTVSRRRKTEWSQFPPDGFLRTLLPNVLFFSGREPGSHRQCA